MDGQALAEKVGFVICLFTGTPGGKYFKCWFDGFPEYTYKTSEELLGFTQALGPNPELATKMNEALLRTDVFLWDVISETIDPYHGSAVPPVTAISTIAEVAKSGKPQEKKATDHLTTASKMMQQDDKYRQGWKSFFNFIVNK